jgi:DNA helicase II / ATP-dependent DNA helicase PcrA
MYSKLSNSQKPILEKTGKFVVRACPGSGKTYCVAAKLSKLISEWDTPHKGIAAISFTNTAWQEIRKKCKEEFKTELNHPHFLGTIDSFINQFIFLPFGHLEMKCNKRPVLVGEPYGIWNSKQFAMNHFDNVSFDIEGNPYALNKLLIKGDWSKNKSIVETKKRLNRAGFAIQADANFFAMKVLENHSFKSVLQSLVQKFSWLIIDEAQDTSDIQMRIIELLIAEGLENVMIVGDPDQAIFVWNKAKPELFNQKYNDWKENSMELFESHRSSELICNVVHKLASSDKTKIVPAINNITKDFKSIPEIWVYDNNNKQDTIDLFIEKCKNIDINPTMDSTIVLSRSNDFFEKPFPTFKNKPINPWCENGNFVREFMKGKYLIDNNNFIEGYKYIERAYVKICLSKTEGSVSQEEINDFIKNKGGIVKFRISLQNLVTKLPCTNLKLGSWVQEANKTLMNPKFTFKINSKANNLTFNQIFPMANSDNNDAEYKISTIHKVKGETYEAVLVFLKEKAVTIDYKKVLEIMKGEVPKSYKETTIEQCKEEARIVYVAISRPSKFLVIATPNDKSKALWEKTLELNIKEEISLF